jgi:hypothetical protein
MLPDGDYVELRLTRKERLVYGLRVDKDENRKFQLILFDQRALVMEMMDRYGGTKQRDIGEYLGQLDYTLVSRERKRVE